jgi:hypothetical protein
MASIVAAERLCNGIFLGFSDSVCRRFLCEYPRDGFLLKIPPMILRNFWIAAAALVAATHAEAAQTACVPPAGFVNSPHPRIAAAQDLVAHREEVVIEASMRAVRDAGSRPLKDQIKQSDALPGVSGNYMLSDGDFGTEGSRRLVCLTDGSTLVEQVLFKDENRFRYVVWNYTSEKARPIAYGVGEFVHTALSDTSTRVTWTYSFGLNSERFPGMLGGTGRFLFRKFFLEREYASMMRGVLESTKQQAESIADPT